MRGNAQVGQMSGAEEGGKQERRREERFRKNKQFLPFPPSSSNPSEKRAATTTTKNASHPLFGKFLHDHARLPSSDAKRERAGGDLSILKSLSSAALRSSSPRRHEASRTVFMG